MPGCGVFYATYETAKAVLTERVPGGAFNHLASAAVACLASLSIYTPMEVVKQRAMVTPGATSRTVIARLLKQEGPLGFFRGLGPAALTWTPYFSIYFSMYESLCSQVTRKSASSTEEVPFLAALGCGLLAGTAAAVLTTPLDVVKTHVQVGNLGSWAVIHDVLADGGMGGFFRGMMPRVLMLAPTSSLTIAFYTFFQKVATNEVPPRKGAATST